MDKYTIEVGGIYVVKTPQGRRTVRVESMQEVEVLTRPQRSGRANFWRCLDRYVCTDMNTGEEVKLTSARVFLRKASLYIDYGR